MRSSRWFVQSLLLLLAHTLSDASPGVVAGEITFNRDIRPILAENCFNCHGPDSGSRQADLRLDQREAALEMGAIVPGEPDESSLIERIHSAGDDIMPPPSTKKQLTEKQKELLKRWIVAGAEYEPHWSFIAPKRPEVRNQESGVRGRNPVDAFVAARLEREGLSMAPEADRRTLARRVSLDLIGLPPSPEMVEAFVADESPNAYEKYVDQLLASPHWGEHRARYWLDVARYGDTHGIHFDNHREIWSYRDWVIAAFNKNQPFDQFTIEQLAGDLLPGRTLDQLIATGFNRCNITTNESGSIEEEYLVLYTRDRTETTAQTWLGLTAGCAVCHDHKFDPLSQREFYQLAAFFNNTTQRGLDDNVAHTQPTIMLPAPLDSDRLAKLAAELAEVRRQMDQRRQAACEAFDQWLKTASSEEIAESVPGESLVLHLPLVDETGDILNVKVNGKMFTGGADLNWQDGPHGQKALEVDPGVALQWSEVGNFKTDHAFSMAAWIKFTQSDVTGAILAHMNDHDRLRGWDFWVQGNRIGMHLSQQWPNNAIKSLANVQIPAHEWHHVAVTYDGSGRADGVRIYYDGQPQIMTPEALYVARMSPVRVPLKLGQRDRGSQLNHTLLHDVRLYEKTLSAQEVEQLAQSARIASALRKPFNKQTDDDRDALCQWWLNSVDADYQQLRAKEAALIDEEVAIKSRVTVAHVMQEQPTPAVAYVLNRGEYDTRGEEVSPDTPAMLPPMPKDFPKNRLGFARWLLLPEHPLTARVAANRMWQELFGTGLVRTAGDFGVSGELPVNQELLDWLAVEFRESGWNVKQFYKLLVMSATYRQAAITTPEKLEKDPDNRLLSRGPRFRMDAEMVRDHALAASGLLVPKLGGPSVKPYQPPGIWDAVAIHGSNTRHYVQDTGEKLYRRSLYTFWKRATPPPSMEVFNAPNREVCTVRRERTNTPLQALATLNDVQMIEAARHLAQVALKSSADEETRLQTMARRLLARTWNDKELAIVKLSLADLSRYYAEHPDDAAQLIAVGDSPANAELAPEELAAWTMLANQLMNLDEVLNK